MAGKQAKTLSTDHIDDLLFFAERSRHPLRNRLIVLLSVKAGLRAAEIAKLSWDMVLDPSGEVGRGPIVRSERGGAMQPMSIVVWFSRTYEALGLDGCSSHSGRLSLKDVEAILDAHYLGRDIQLAEAAVLKLEARTKL